MPRVPLIGRLSVYVINLHHEQRGRRPRNPAIETMGSPAADLVIWARPEYLALGGSFVLIFLEIFLRIVTLALPNVLLIFLYNRSRALFDFLSSPQGRRQRAKQSDIVKDIRDASDFVEMCALYGYYAEEHVVQTADGYLLGVHRLGWRRGEERMKVNSGPGSLKKKVVYLHHGLLMNSEVWVCVTEIERCLPFQLVEKGYDVWLGNNRGNKYSKKSIDRSPASARFWNFSMDEFAFHDIPNTIAYVLETTAQASLSYIGFSQGTAQAFASLSIHPKLNDQIDVFIALAPAMAPRGLNNGIVNSLIKASPEVIFLAFGRRSILKSTTMWQTFLYPPIFVRIIDMCISFLFGWQTKNIAPHQKLAAYPHLYSFTSTKSIVHWFQIIRNQTFQMYDDDVQAPLSIIGSSKYYKVARFPTQNIKTPIMLIYGGCDSLVDIGVMLKQLPSHTVAIEIPHFEHLDFLWATDIDKHVFPHVFEGLESYAHQSDLEKLTLSGVIKTSQLFGPGKLNQPPSYASEDDDGRTPSGRLLSSGNTSGILSGGMNHSPAVDLSPSQQQPRRRRLIHYQDRPSPPLGLRVTNPDLSLSGQSSTFSSPPAPRPSSKHVQLLDPVEPISSSSPSTSTPPPTMAAPDQPPARLPQPPPDVDVDDNIHADQDEDDADDNNVRAVTAWKPEFQLCSHPQPRHHHDPHLHPLPSSSPLSASSISEATTPSSLLPGNPAKKKARTGSVASLGARSLRSSSSTTMSQEDGGGSYRAPAKPDFGAAGITPGLLRATVGGVITSVAVEAGKMAGGERRRISSGRAGAAASTSAGDAGPGRAAKGTQRTP
ncbi:MAG: cholesterol esterase [Phylliscum demangeonii]|nr:MAG: cholesterol esterase [Phylliscum demangeonii]